MVQKNIKQGIIVGSSDARRETWLSDIQKNLEGYEKYPIKYNITDRFELATIKQALVSTDWDEFMFLPDSTIIKDFELFDLIFKKHKGKSVSLVQHPDVGGMYLMKYKREILEKMGEIPIAQNKAMAVYWEIVFHAYYAGLDQNVVVLFPDVFHTEIFKKKHGRINMIMGNKYFEKWKGDWGQRSL
jgi:hypothetical protein